MMGNCFSELTYSIYVDGELANAEARRVEAHLSLCTQCRELVEALRAESRLLTRLLDEVAEPERAALPAAWRPARLQDVLWTGLAVVVAAAGVRAVFNWLGELRQPGVDWMDPFSFSGQLTLFFTSIFYFVQEGATMLIAPITAISALILALLAVVAGVWLIRRRTTALVVLATLILLWGGASPGQAIDTRHVQTLTIASDEVIEDTLIVQGQTLTVEGVVNGDLIVFAKRLAMRGTVKGNLFTFVQSLEVDGRVEGGVHGWVQTARLRGTFGRNVYLGVQNLELASGARVNGDLTLFAAEALLEGSISRDLNSFGETVELRGAQIGRNIRAYAEQIILSPTARVGGNLDAFVKKAENLQIAAGAKIEGKTETHVREVGRKVRSARMKTFVQKGVGLGVSFLIGLLLFWLFPTLFSARVDGAGAALRTAGVGFLTLVVTPVAVIVLGLVLVGIGILADIVPIALLVPVLILVVWSLALYLAKIPVGFFLGQMVLPSAPGQRQRFALPLLVGLVIFYVGVAIPYLGPVFHVLVWLLGLGMLVGWGWRYWRRPTSAA